MSGANLLDLLGSMEPCQVTIAEQNQARISHDNDENNPLLPEKSPSSVLRFQNDDKKEQEQSSTVNHSLSWSGNQWSCHNCTLRGDKFTMQNIPCKENNKKK